MEESSLQEQKTPWEKEKLLVTSNFSFSHSVFKRLVVQTPKYQGLFGKWLKCSKDGISENRLETDPMSSHPLHRFVDTQIRFIRKYWWETEVSGLTGFD